MKKIWEWLTGNVIKEVGQVIDDLTTTKEEKLEAQRLITEILEKADKEAQEQVTARWDSDMKSDSFLSKNIRPMVLIYLTVIFTVCAQRLLVTVYGAYFVGRSWEKAKSITNNQIK